MKITREKILFCCFHRIFLATKEGVKENEIFGVGQKLYLNYAYFKNKIKKKNYSFSVLRHPPKVSLLFAFLDHYGM